MNTAAKGRSWEHEVIHALESIGCSVIRGAASKGEFYGEKVDLIATRKTTRNEFRALVSVYPVIGAVGVQCKAKGRKKF